MWKLLKVIISQVKKIVKYQNNIWLFTYIRRHKHQLRENEKGRERGGDLKCIFLFIKKGEYDQIK